MSQHVCQLFDSDASRAEAVATFLADGLRAGDHVIVVSRPAHWKSIDARLDALGFPVHEQIAQRRLSLYDAAATLAQISPRGRLSPFAFNEVMGAAMQALAGQRVRGYGEMVDILAERGELAEALELEELWNHAAEMVPISIMCAYSSAHFAGAATHRGLREICLAHTDVRRHPQDTLANWILTMAHHTVGSSSLH